ncbi:MAG: hypothetical protein OEQ29_12345, partial [Alphaproteobacteria bacterium]|nr:hypothetical protein [Alphaproteobacteria bacterium]
MGRAALFSPAFRGTTHRLNTRFAMVCRFASGLAATLLLLASGTNVAAQGTYSEDRKYTVKDLTWCLNARPPPIQTCGFYVSVVADVVRISDV